MTFASELLPRSSQMERVPVLETARLKLRAPGSEDAKAIAALANDMRVAAHTARLPHPYGVADAEEFIAAANSREGEACFVVTRDGRLIGACGVDLREDGPELGYWFGAPFWGARLCHRGGARTHRLRLRRSRLRKAAFRRAGQ
jgi:RimJ/RimL family protein N-acetyltransferase